MLSMSGASTCMRFSQSHCCACAAGELLNCNTFDVATHAAIELKADKLLCMTTDAVADLNLPQWLPVTDAEHLLKDHLSRVSMATVACADTLGCPLPEDSSNGDGNSATAHAQQWSSNGSSHPVGSSSNSSSSSSSNTSRLPGLHASSNGSSSGSSGRMGDSMYSSTWPDIDRTRNSNRATRSMPAAPFVGSGTPATTNNNNNSDGHAGSHANNSGNGSNGKLGVHRQDVAKLGVTANQGLQQPSPQMRDNPLQEIQLDLDCWQALR